MGICCNAAMEPKQRLSPFIYSPDQLGPWEIELVITHLGVCHSDLHVIDPNLEIIGTVVDKGEMVIAFQVGDKIGIDGHHGSGGLAQRIRTDSRFAVKVPDTLFSSDGSPLLCKQKTVYSTCLERNVTHLTQVAGGDDTRSLVS